MQLATQLSERPELLAAQLTLIQRGLEATTYVGEPLHTLTGLRQSTSTALEQLRTALLQAGLLADTGVSQSLRCDRAGVPTHGEVPLSAAPPTAA